MSCRRRMKKIIWTDHVKNYHFVLHPRCAPYNMHIYSINRNSQHMQQYIKGDKFRPLSRPSSDLSTTSNISKNYTIIHSIVLSNVLIEPRSDKGLWNYLPLYIAKCVVQEGLLNKCTYYLPDKWSITKSQGR
jgi:hypothetical protein